MQIQIYHKDYATTFPVVVYPLLKGAHLATQLDQIAAKYELDATLLKDDFHAEKKETWYLLKGQQRVYLMGLGSEAIFPSLLTTARSFFFKERFRIPGNVWVDFRFCTQESSSPALLLEAFVNGCYLSTADLGRFKKEKGAKERTFSNAAELHFLVNDQTQVLEMETAAARGISIGETQSQMMDLVNAPSNKKNPLDIGELAHDSATKYGYTCMVLGKEQIQELGLEALLAVNQGSSHPPVFILLEYHSKLRTPKTVGLVGKGVTFDTGGLSIKAATNMHHMKSDMGGAAAVLGAVELAAKFQLPVNVIGIIPATDNSVDAAALKPSDVIDSYSGKTIEIINTDAEGRLILADGLAYLLKNYKVDHILDLATLTGSAIQTLGYHAACLFSNDDQLAEELHDLGMKYGERLWRLPLWKEYAEDLHSDVADLKNYSGRPISGAIGAAKFLEAFIEKHPSWAHLDIAGMAFKDSEYAIHKSATGFGIRLVLEYLKAI